ncbi:MAG: ABC transporter permease [Bauldia sp.]
MRRRVLVLLAFVAAFLVVAAGFFLIIGQPPLATLGKLVSYAVGDPYSLSETLVKTTPILFCALAVIVPARLGLISVGGEGQFYFGALLGTGFMLFAIDWPAWLLMPGILVAGALGGAIWASIAGVLKARIGVNETIVTLLLNYPALFLVNALTFGPWRDPASLGWPASARFPEDARLPQLFDTRVHLGLVIGIIVAVACHVALTRTRWGLGLSVLRGNAKVAAMVGLHRSRQILVTMAIGGALAGFAGIAEASVIEGRLQQGISVGYGLTGFLVAWLTGHNALVAIVVSFLIGGLVAAGDALQLFARIPSASATILQGLMFATALAIGALAARRSAARG